MTWMAPQSRNAVPSQIKLMKAITGRNIMNMPTLRGHVGCSSLISAPRRQ